jgi:UPF0716 family protein affecting phage T7 exclusion
MAQMQAQIKHGMRKPVRVVLLGLVMLVAAVISFTVKAKAAGDVFLVLMVLCVLAGCVMAYSVRMRAVRQLQANLEGTFRKPPRKDVGV